MVECLGGLRVGSLENEIKTNLAFNKVEVKVETEFDNDLFLKSKISV